MFDVEGARAVLIGTTTGHRSIYPEDLPQCRNNIHALGELLARKDLVGIRNTHIRPVIDQPRQLVVKQAAEVAAQATSFLLVYYVGHGVPGFDNNNRKTVYLTTPESTRDEIDVTALGPDQLMARLYGTKAKIKIFIFDACYSREWLPATMRSMSGDDLVVASVAARLRHSFPSQFSLVAGEDIVPSVAQADDPFTVLTGELLRVLEDGLPNDQPFISVQELFHETATAAEEVYRRLEFQDYPRYVYSLMQPVAVARNRYRFHDDVETFQAINRMTPYEEFEARREHLAWIAEREGEVTVERVYKALVDDGLDAPNPLAMRLYTALSEHMSADRNWTESNALEMYDLAIDLIRDIVLIHEMLCAFRSAERIHGRNGVAARLGMSDNAVYFALHSLGLEGPAFRRPDAAVGSLITESPRLRVVTEELLKDQRGVAI